MTAVHQRLFILFFFTSFFLFYLSPVYAEAQMIGQVVWVKGTVKAISTDNKERVLERRASIYEKDTVVTPALGSGEIVFTDSSIITLRDNTTLKFDEYHFDKDHPSNNKSIASLVKGGFRTITGLISKENPPGYQLKTPVATIGVRGTIYTLFFDPYKLGLVLQIDKGIIAVSNKLGTLEMNAALGNTYATVKAATEAPASLKTQPAILKSQPNVTPASAPSTSQTTSGAGGRTTTPSKINETPTGGVTTPSTGTAAPAKSGGDGNVKSDFCIS